MDVSPEIIQRLQKVMALKESPSEGEAQAATEMLERLLTQHNLSIADLEQKGQAQPAVGKKGHDLGKAAFKWKLNLADAVADTFYCHPLVDYRQKTVAFVGRPDNVESVLRTYAWLIDQIKRLATAERYTYIRDHQEHVDPLRWQLQFGEGAVSRLTGRLWELKKRREGDGQVAGLVKHHLSEVSDWLEQNLGYRVDGRDTALWQKHKEDYDKWVAAQEAAKAAMTPEERERKQKLAEQIRKEAAEADERWRAKERAKRRAEETRRETYRNKHGYYPGESPEERAAEAQRSRATRAGWVAGDRVNIEPFLAGRADPTRVREL